MRAIEWVLSRLFPPKCVLCRKILEGEETDLCTDCRKNLPLAEKTEKTIRYVDRWTAVCYYEEKVRESLLRFKFSGRQSYASCYGRLLAACILREFSGDFDLLTYVPVSAKRRRKRGYDQTALLAEAVGQELGIPVVRTLKKIRNNPAQSSIRDPAQRRANVSGVYRAEEVPLQNRRILLLDDILTTGATVSECARVLRTAGAASVAVAAFACGRPKN